MSGDFGVSLSLSFRRGEMADKKRMSRLLHHHRIDRLVKVILHPP